MAYPGYQESILYFNSHKDWQGIPRNTFYIRFYDDRREAITREEALFIAMIGTMPMSYNTIKELKNGEYTREKSKAKSKRDAEAV